MQRSLHSLELRYLLKVTNIKRMAIMEEPGIFIISKIDAL
jgi:hypothetical protein